ncbi:hypothetical protein VTK73DRAFT_10360 [Phialemonium thermophilum]|uniref:Uncharacterized protein n=1 Tax=Phialemonium thermophilum TaxID=223376 RepID=A0ABR3XH05_9PEZI
MAAHRAVLRRQLQFLRPRAGGAPGQRRAQSTGKIDDKAAKIPAGEETQIPVANNVPTLPFWQRLGPLSRAAEAYARAQRSRPYLTQLCSSLVIYFCADLSAQNISGKDYDSVRTARSLTIGAISAIPSYKWFVFLSQHFNYASHVVSLAVKVVVNQLCFTPVFNSYFFGMQALLAGDDLPQVWERIRRTVPVSFVNSMKLWPAVTAFSFTFIPMEYRSIFAGFIAIGWQTYLTYLNRVAEEEEESKVRDTSSLQMEKASTIG